MFVPYSPPATNPPTHRWRGETGQWFEFSIFRVDQIWDFEGIVYIGARDRFDGLYDPLYIGQSGDGYTRFSKHEKFPRARQLGMTHIHVLFVSEKWRRLKIETDLRHAIWTPLNEQPTPALNWIANPLNLTGLGALLNSLAPPPYPVTPLGIAGFTPPPTFTNVLNAPAGIADFTLPGFNPLGGLGAFGFGNDFLSGTKRRY
jgi:hypothetical protein